MSQRAQCVYGFGPYHLDVGRRRLRRGGEAVQLTPKAFDILLALIERRGDVVDKDELMKLVWPDSFVEEGNLTYNISMLRKALGERAGEHQYIVTVPGRGYQFVETVNELPNEAGEPGLTERIPTDSVVQETPIRSQHEALLVQEYDRSKSIQIHEFLISWAAQNKRAVLIAAVILMIAGTGISVGLYKLISGKESQIELSEPFQKMRVTRLTTTGKASAAASSPDGKYVVHAMGARRNQSLWLRHIATGSDKEIVPTAAVDYSTVTFSRDGNYIYFLRPESGGSDLYRVPVLGDSIQKLVRDVDSGITFSPDGRQMAYLRGYPERAEARLLIASADGGNEQTLVTKHMPDVYASPGRAWGPAWSPDGAVIAFALRNDLPEGKYWDLTTVRLKDNVEQQITFQKWPAFGQLSWLSDGSGLIVAAADEESNPAQQIWHVAYPKGDVRRITNDTNDYSGVTLTADSSVLVTVQIEQSSNIWMAAGGDATRAAQITANNVDGLTGISWAPDGRILYTTRARGSSDIWIMNADGTGQNQLTVDARENVNPSVSSDGRYIVFASNRSGNRCLWRMDIDGNNPKQLTFGTEARHPDITPDGQSVVYVDLGSGKLTLWKVSIEGGNQVQLTDYSSSFPAVSPDGTQIVFGFIDEQATPKRAITAIVPFGGGPPRSILDLTSRRLRWTSDGRAVTYIDTRNGVSNIWAQPVYGGAPRQLTDFKTDLIFAHTWSKDGEQLACARGTRISDVVLIGSIR